MLAKLLRPLAGIVHVITGTEEYAMKRVLVLDDDADLCLVLIETFMMLGASECLQAHSLSELQKIEKNALQSDVIVLDINLGPEEPSGIDAYDWLMARAYKGRIVFLTGHARSHPLVKKAQDIAGVQLLEKPTPIENLEVLLR